MIAVDTSALLAILAKEAKGPVCLDRLNAEDEIVISAGTLTEAFIIAGQRNIHGEMAALIEDFGCTVVPVTAAAANRIGDIYRRWGKGNHPTGLNFGDCFAYDVAQQHGCPLLFVGDDFAKTDVASAL